MHFLLACSLLSIVVSPLWVWFLLSSIDLLISTSFFEISSLDSSVSFAAAASSASSWFFSLSFMSWPTCDTIEPASSSAVRCPGCYSSVSPAVSTSFFTASFASASVFSLFACAAAFFVLAVFTPSPCTRCMPMLSRAPAKRTRTPMLTHLRRSQRSHDLIKDNLPKPDSDDSKKLRVQEITDKATRKRAPEELDAEQNGGYRSIVTKPCWLAADRPHIKLQCSGDLSKNYRGSRGCVQRTCRARSTLKSIPTERSVSRDTGNRRWTCAVGYSLGGESPSNSSTPSRSAVKMNGKCWSEWTETQRQTSRKELASATRGDT